MEIEDFILKMLNASLPQKNTSAHLWDSQAPTKWDLISTRNAFNRRGFPKAIGNQAFIRASEFAGLVARLLKNGQPGFFL